jgi:hypothetical protein
MCSWRETCGRVSVGKFSISLSLTVGVVVVAIYVFSVWVSPGGLYAPVRALWEANTVVVVVSIGNPSIKALVLCRAGLPILCARTRPPGYASDVVCLTDNAGGVMAVVVAFDPHAAQGVFMTAPHLLQI